MTGFWKFRTERDRKVLIWRCWCFFVSMVTDQNKQTVEDSSVHPGSASAQRGKYFFMDSGR